MSDSCKRSTRGASITCLPPNIRYRPPQSPVDALIQAENNLEYQSTTKDGKVMKLRAIQHVNSSPLELIDTYLNGARILANDRLSYLIISPPPSSVPASPVTSTNESSAEQDEQDVDILICVTHYIGDGMAVSSVSFGIHLDLTMNSSCINLHMISLLCLGAKILLKSCKVC